MKRSRFKNKAKKTKKPIDISKKNSVICFNLNKRTQFKHFSSYNFADRKPFPITLINSKADTDNFFLNEGGDLTLKKQRKCKSSSSISS